MTREATTLIVPGLRDHVRGHWQTLLASQLPACAPMGRNNLDCRARVEAIEEEATRIDGPIILVAHSGGVIATLHWARQTKHADAVRGALLATPADLNEPMPDGYPSMQALNEGSWLPVPRSALPFRSIVAASRNDPLARFERVAALASCWGSTLVDLGEVGHLNRASGFGHWPQACALIKELDPAASESIGRVLLPC